MMIQFYTPPYRVICLPYILNELYSAPSQYKVTPCDISYIPFQPV